MSGSPSPADPAVRAQAAKVLSSTTFAGAGRLRRLFSYLIDATLVGRADQIKEYAIGVDVFDRGPSFDPRTDAVVRLEARRLRHKLRDYYDAEGRSDQVLIDLPKGGYVPAFRSRAETRRRAARWKPIALGSALLLLAGLAVAWVTVRPNRAHTPPSVAVLPFPDFGQEPEQYFADGLVEDITTELAKIGGLRVVSRTSAFQFRGKEIDVRDVGRRLRVGAVLEGSVRRIGGRLRVNVQLIDSHSGFHLWSEAYDRDLSASRSLHHEIARSVARALGLPVAGEPPKAASAEARSLYYRGLYLKHKREPAALRDSIPFFEKAVALDPEFAAAWYALADSRATLSLHGWQEAGAVALARQEAMRALRADPSLAEPHSLLAWMAFYFDWDKAAAERQFQAALELNPNSARTWRTWSLVLAAGARFDEAVAAGRQGAGLDPLSNLAATDLGVVCFCARRYEDAARQAAEVLEMNPSSGPARILMAITRAMQGRDSEAVQECRKAADSPFRNDALAPFAWVHAAAGRRAEALALLEELRAIPGRIRNHVEEAVVYAALGDADAAFKLLEEGFRHRHMDFAFLNVDPRFDPLRQDPRFAALWKRTGL